MLEQKIDRIVELDIELDDFSEEELEEFGVAVVSIVEEPAIGENFHAFSTEEFVKPRAGESENNFIGRCMSDLQGEYPDEEQRLAVCYSYYEGETHEFETYDDYPQAARDNACRALKYAEENGWGDCGTQVGKVRANQLCSGEKLSRETIARMSSFRRQQENKNTPYGEGCGGLMWDAWGGDEGIAWAERKLKQIDEEMSKHTNHQFSLDDEKRVVTGPLIIPNKMILRRNADGTPYYVFFSKATIRKMAEKFFRLNKHNNTDKNHDWEVTTNNTLIESWISESPQYDKAYHHGFSLPAGTWYVSYKINDDSTWDDIKSGKLKGFSLAGPFIERLATEKIHNQTLSKIIEILNQIDEA